MRMRNAIPCVLTVSVNALKVKDRFIARLRVAREQLGKINVEGQVAGLPHSFVTHLVNSTLNLVRKLSDLPPR
jgi:hypothetical protein